MESTAPKASPRSFTSYRGPQLDRTMDLRLIPEYDGSPGQPVVEWLEKVELVCSLRGVEDVASVIPLRLTGGAFAVYLQLAAHDRADVGAIKRALLAAFAADSFVAFEQFMARKLSDGEMPDVFLADLRRLASLFGGLPEKALTCAFVAGMPEDVRQILRAGSRMEDLTLPQILERSRAVMADKGQIGAANVCFGASGAAREPRAEATGLRCYACGGPNHFARDCRARQRPGNSSAARRQRAQGNGGGKGASARASPPHEH